MGGGAASGLVVCHSVHSASAGSSHGIGVPGTSSPLPETVTPEVATSEGEGVVHVFVRGSRALSVASESTVPFLVLLLR